MDATVSELRQKLESVQRELVAEASLADCGETAAILAHEVNDYLNTVMLQLAILEGQITPSARSELATLRRQSARLAELVRVWQDSRRKSRLTEPAVDLNQIVRETTEAIKQNQSIFAEAALELALESDVPPVAGSIVDLRRLCAFLIKNAILASRASGRKTIVRSVGEDDSAVLEIRPGFDLERQLDSNTGDGTNRLELACCRRLIQRLQGQSQVSGGTSEGIVLSVKFADGRKR
jgi:phosphoglycerate-specific signal transduction histidine kinase